MALQMFACTVTQNLCHVSISSVEMGSRRCMLDDYRVITHFSETFTFFACVRLGLFVTYRGISPIAG